MSPKLKVVYEAEKLAGLADTLANNKVRIVSAAEVKKAKAADYVADEGRTPDTSNDVPLASCASCGKAATAGLACPACGSPVPLPVAPTDLPNTVAKASANPNQPDLYYLRSLLASTGVNKNGDFFPTLDTWLARKTPRDKPINLEHTDAVYGHITDCEAIDLNDAVMADDVDIDGLPESFSVFAEGVLYKFRKDDAAQESIDSIIERIEDGDLWVSMEALFANFDYVLAPTAASWMDADMSKARIITRSPETAFLTASLRQYGGTGIYGGYLVGRVLRDIVFSGMGLVKNPANPTSAIFGPDGKPLSGNATAASIADLEQMVYSTKKDNIMNDEVKKQIADLEAKVKAAETTASEAVAKLKSVEAELGATKSLVEEAKAGKTKSDEALAKVTSERDELLKEAGRAKAEARFKDIVEKVKAAYKTDSDEKATAVAKTLENLTDDKVTEHLAAASALFTGGAQTPPTASSAPNVTGQKPKPISQLTIANVTPNPEPDMTVSGEGSHVALAAEQQSKLAAELASIGLLKAKNETRNI